MQLSKALRKVKAILSSVKLKQDTLADGSIIQFDGERLDVDSCVYMLDQAGNEFLLANGSYLTKTGTTFSIVNSMVTDVKVVSAANTEDKPVKQAQAEQETPKENKDLTMNKEEIKATEVVAEKLDATDPDNDNDIDVAVSATVDLNDVIAQALIPVYEQIAALGALIQAYSSFSETAKTQMSEIEKKVSVLSKQPAGAPIEETFNTFSRAPQKGSNRIHDLMTAQRI